MNKETLVKNSHSVGLYVLAASLGIAVNAFADETLMQKAETDKNQATDAVKKTYRSAKDQACPLVNGKVVCAEKKIKHSAQNLSDESKTKATEVKHEIKNKTE